MKHLGFASLSAVNQYLRYARAKGLDTRALIARAGMTPELLQEDNGRIKGEQFQSLLKAMIQEANDPILGLNSSQFVQPQSYNVLGNISLHCSTIGEAIERIPPFERLVGDMGTTRIQRNDKSLHLTWHCAYQDTQVAYEMVDNVLASWTRYARWLAQETASAQRIELCRPNPGKTWAKHYERFFGCAVLFDQKQNSIVLNQSMLCIPLKRGDGSHLQLLENRARSLLSSLILDDESFSEQVARSIRAHLQMGTARKELIAQEFNICERTLQRRLKQDGCHYQGLLDQARFERARELLQHSNLSLQDIAYNIGYSDERSFFRSFRKWSELGPMAFRKATQRRSA